MTIIKFYVPPSMAADGSSILSDIYVNNFSYVKKGQKIVKLDCGDYVLVKEASYSGIIFFHKEVGSILQQNDLFYSIDINEESGN